MKSIVALCKYIINDTHSSVLCQGDEMMPRYVIPYRELHLAIKIDFPGIAGCPAKAELGIHWGRLRRVACFVSAPRSKIRIQNNPALR